VSYLGLRQSYASEASQAGPPPQRVRTGRPVPASPPRRVFPPPGPASVAARRRTVVDALFRQVIEATLRSRQGPSHYLTK
jgi:hypothetical protein